MTKPLIVIHDAVTGDTVEREMTDAECAQYEKDQVQWAKAEADRLAAQQSQEAAKASAAAKLKALGLSDEEVAALTRAVP